MHMEQIDAKRGAVLRDLRDAPPFGKEHHRQLERVGTGRQHAALMGDQRRPHAIGMQGLDQIENLVLAPTPVTVGVQVGNM